MTTFFLNMYEDNFLPSSDPVFLPALNRSLYIAEGSATIETARAAQFLPTGTAWLDDQMATVTTGRSELRLLRWELELREQKNRELTTFPNVKSVQKLSSPIELDEEFEWLLRCDSVSFPTGGIAYTHVHQGPGIRCVLNGSFRIETEGSTHHYQTDDAWLETGYSPVTAFSSETMPSSFVRCFILPANCKGRSSVRYVNEHDWNRPKPQTYHIFGERIMALRGATAER